MVTKLSLHSYRTRTGLAYIRSVEQPWAYELFYVALLYQTGMLCFIIYMFAIMWIFWYSLRIIKSDVYMGLYLIPILVGVICFLIANATNLYLAKYDYMWIIFLPIDFINYWLLN